MTINSASAPTTLHHRVRRLSGNFFGLRWSLSLLRPGVPSDDKLRDLPPMVGTAGIVLPSLQEVQLKLDFEHTYITGADNRPARCRIRVYSPVNALLQRVSEEVPELIHPMTYRSQDPTVILCEPIAIGGITTHSEQIATAVWHQLDRPTSLTWIEHWWESSFPSLLCVQFHCTMQGVLIDPEWTVVQQSEVEQILGPLETLHREEPAHSD